MSLYDDLVRGNRASVLTAMAGIKAARSLQGEDLAIITAHLASEDEEVVQATQDALASLIDSNRTAAVRAISHRYQHAHGVEKQKLEGLLIGWNTPVRTTASQAA